MVGIACRFRFRHDYLSPLREPSMRATKAHYFALAIGDGTVWHAAQDRGSSRRSEPKTGENEMLNSHVPA